MVFIHEPEQVGRFEEDFNVGNIYELTTYYDDNHFM